MNKIFISCIALISTQISFAQDNRLWLSLGAGVSNTSALDKNYVTGNGFNVQADAYVPFYRKGWDGTVKGSGFTLGVNISGNYTGIRNSRPDNTNVAERYQVYQGNVVVTDQSEGKTSGSFSGLAGIQARMDWGKFNLSPSVNFGYLHFKQKGYTQTGSLSMNGETQEKDLVKAEQQSANGMVFKPQLKIGYNITRNLSFFISPAMVFWPETRYTTYYLVPQGGFNAKNTYEAGQLAKGTWESSTNTGRYRLMEINAGITVAIGKRQPTIKQTQGMNFGEKVGSGLQSGANADLVSSEIPFTGKNIGLQNFIITVDGNGAKLNDGTPVVNSKTVKGKITTKQTGAASASYARVRITQPETGDDETTITDEYGNFKIKLVHDTLHHVYINDEEFGKIKIIEDNNTQRVAGGPIGGIIVKGGKNPGGQMKTMTTNDNGEFSFEITERGNYVFQISAPDEPNHANRTEAQDFNTTRSNRDNRLATSPKTDGTKTDAIEGGGGTANKPGTPIGGIIVKGGKNPGGQMFTTTTNANGEFEFDVTEPGNYKFEISNPAPAGKGINEAGIKGIAKPGGAVSSSYAATGRVAGGPLKGIDVKLGKSPNDGIRARAVTNKKGEIEFQGLEPGMYEMTPDLPQRAEAQDFNTTRSNRERGQLATRPGGPIGGIIVKGGKTPGGATTNLTIDNDGTIRFEVLEAGNYKFTFSNRQETQGIVNTTKSNTKD